FDHRMLGYAIWFVAVLHLVNVARLAKDGPVFAGAAPHRGGGDNPSRARDLDACCRRATAARAAPSSHGACDADLGCRPCSAGDAAACGFPALGGVIAIEDKDE